MGNHFQMLTSGDAELASQTLIAIAPCRASILPAWVASDTRAENSEIDSRLQHARGTSERSYV